MTIKALDSKQLLDQERKLKLSALLNIDAIQIGQIAFELGRKRNLPIAIEVRIGSWVVFHASLPGSSPENDRWIERKVSVVMLSHHSTLFERVSAEERGVDWHKEKGVTDETHAIHGGAIPLITEEGFQGILVISGLSQVEDHRFAVEVLSEFLSQNG